MNREPAHVAPAASSASSAPASMGSAVAGRPASAVASGNEPAATEQQIVSIRKLVQVLGKPEPEASLSYNQARALITQLSAEYQQRRRAS